MRISCDPDSPYVTRLSYRAMVLFNGEVADRVFDADDQAGRIVRYGEFNPVAVRHDEREEFGHVELRFFHKDGSPMPYADAVAEIEREREARAARGW